VTVSAPHAELEVLIIDDHVLFAQTLELALRRAGFRPARLDLAEEAEASSARLVRAVLERRPDVVLLDLDLGPAGDGFPVIEPSAKAGIDVVVVTGADEPGQWARAVMSGARKVVSKSSSLEDVLTTVRRLEEGLPVMEPDERQQLLDAWVARRAGNEERWQRFDQLTLRESEVLGLLMRGHGPREIARRGNTAEGTVRSQVKSILGKLGVSSQLAAVGLAYRIGWRPPYDPPPEVD
jgi:two-component system, NarL family, nitrate/nitrite response regulator NarL